MTTDSYPKSCFYEVKLDNGNSFKMEVITNNDEIKEEREAIMHVYDINHPLQCGVCDKSGECELQDNTLFMDINTQQYAIADTPRYIVDWGKIKYDAGLCIVCERCTTSCKDMIGDSALKTIKREGSEVDEAYKETMPKDAFTMWKKMNKSLIGSAAKDPNTLDCIECGECIAVCPVGALVSSDFQYTTNAWELNKVPSSCAHCSQACHLSYDVKHTSIEDAENRVYRVTNDFHFTSLCGAGRFGYDFENRAVTKDETAFNRAVDALKNADTIAFDSLISNEEALILQSLKETLGLKLYNPDAFAFSSFIKSFESGAGTSYLGTVSSLAKSDFIVSIGTQLTSDAPGVRFALNNAAKINKGAGLYFHPVADSDIAGFSKNLLSFTPKIGSEEALMYIILDTFAAKKLPASVKEVIESFKTTEKVIVTEKVKEKVTELVKEMQTNDAGEEVEVEVEKEKTVSVDKEVEKEIVKNTLFDIAGIKDFSDGLAKLLKKKEKFFLIIGEDAINHANAANIAKLAGIMQRVSAFDVLIIPSKTNTLGVSLICDLDENSGSKVVGYNVEADFTLSASGATSDKMLDMPALNQQEGTVTNIDRRVVVLNAALNYGGYSLNDLANSLGLKSEYTINYTAKLPMSAGYQNLAFDSLENHYSMSGEEKRGYLLKPNTVSSDDSVEKPNNELEFSGTVLYRCNPVSQFNEFTNKTKQLNQESKLIVTDEFAKANDLSNNDTVEVELNSKTVTFGVEIYSKLSGNVALVPTFDREKALFSDHQYRFSSANLRKV
jgi:NADH-quinone oxidoreductase subunit G